MKKFVFILLVIFCCFSARAQQDSSGYRNAIGYEFFGGSPLFTDPVSLCYHHFFLVKGTSNKVRLNVMAGYSTAQTRLYNERGRIHAFPIETGLLLGRKPLKFDLAIGYTPQFGKEDILTVVTLHDNYYTRVTFYDFFMVRIGMSVIPRNKFHFLFFRIAATPIWVPGHNPLPDIEATNYWFVRRFIPLYGGVTIGGAF